MQAKSNKKRSYFDRRIKLMRRKKNYKNCFHVGGETGMKTSMTRLEAIKSRLNLRLIYNWSVFWFNYRTKDEGEEDCELKAERKPEPLPLRMKGREMRVDRFVAMEITAEVWWIKIDAKVTRIGLYSAHSSSGSLLESHSKPPPLSTLQPPST